MKALANLDVLGEFAGSFKTYTELPLTPRAGQWALIDNNISICIEIQEDNLPVWFQITNAGNQVVFEQEVAASVWDIPHKLGSDAVIVQCFDEASAPISPDSIDIIDNDNVRVSFSQDFVGKAYVLYGSEEGRDIDRRSIGNETKQVGVIEFESIVNGTPLRTLVGKLTDGRLITWGHSEQWSHGQGEAGVTAETGFSLPQLPYNRTELKDYYVRWLSNYALMKNGELWVWGDNRSGQLGVGDKSVRKVPVLALTGVAEIIHQDYTVRDNITDQRYALVKMLDGRIMYAGYTGETAWTDTQNGTSWQDLRLPEGVNFSDIKFHYFSGYMHRRILMIQTNDLKVYVCGRNYHGQLGIDTGTGTENAVQWEEVTSLSGIEIKKACGWYGWLSSDNKYANGSSCTLVQSVDNKIYHAGRGYSSGLLYLTGYPKETNPVDSSNQNEFVLIHEDVDYIEVLGSPGCVVYRQNGEWFSFGHSHTFYRVTGESADVTLPSYKQEGIPANAKLAKSHVTHTYTWNIPTVFYDDQFLYVRGRSPYGCLGLGNDDTVQDMVKVDYNLMFDGKIVDMGFYGYAGGVMSLVLTDKGSVYAVGYGGRGLYYLEMGLNGTTHSYSLWRNLCV